jgi:hypothetical protein
MAYIFGGNTGINSPEELAERRALVRSLMARQLGQRPRDMWDGINSLVGAISGRVAENRLDKTEAEGKAGAESAFEPLIAALMKKQTPDLGMLTGVLSNPWLNSGQRSAAEDLYKQQPEANQPITPYQKEQLALDEKKRAMARGAPRDQSTVTVLSSSDNRHFGLLPSMRPLPKDRQLSLHMR